MFTNSITDLNKNGYAIIQSVYSKHETDTIAHCIQHSINSSDSEGQDVFAIRQCLKQIPEVKPLIFTEKLKTILDNNFKSSYHLSKAIYFNKPPHSNWFVSYHQDLSISVKEKIETESYSRWTNKKGQIGVIPPVSILEDIITLRIHLDHTTKDNGALRIIPKSHNKGIIPPDKFATSKTHEVLCEANTGDVMLMKPLTLHASDKTINNTSRRVLHLEFSSLDLTPPLEWLEKEDVL